MVLDILIIVEGFQNAANDISELILFQGVHVTPYVLACLVQAPLETSIDFTAFIHGEVDQVHIDVDGECVFLLILGP